MPTTLDIERVLKRHGIDAKAFCAGAKIGMQTYRTYKRGDRVPSVATVIRVESALNIPRHELRPDVWPPPPKVRSQPA
jgi:hypothetical protein